MELNGVVRRSFRSDKSNMVGMRGGQGQMTEFVSETRSERKTNTNEYSSPNRTERLLLHVFVGLLRHLQVFYASKSCHVFVFGSIFPEKRASQSHRDTFLRSERQTTCPYAYVTESKAQMRNLRPRDTRNTRFKKKDGQHYFPLTFGVVAQLLNSI